LPLNLPAYPQQNYIAGRAALSITTKTAPEDPIGTRNPKTSRAKISASRESSIRGIFWKTPAASTPPAHQAYAEWTPKRIVDWTTKAGVSTRALVDFLYRTDRALPSVP